MSHDTFRIGDIVEIIQLNRSNPMPGGLGLGARGTVVGTEIFGIRVDYGIGKLVWSQPDSIRKIPPPPPQREATSSWDDLIVWRPKETSHV